MSQLTSEIKNAIANVNIAEMLRLKDICDKLHRNDHVDGYKPEDIPTDALYEQLKTQLEIEQSHVANGLLKKQVENDHFIGYREKQELSDMYMAKDAIIKKSSAEEIKGRVICMPKYDGCSVCARFVWKDDEGSFVLDAAETRGDDIGYDDHKSTDMSTKLQLLLDSDRCPWWPKKFNEFHKFANTITLRGEVVLVDKSVKVPPAIYASSQIGLKYGTFDSNGVLSYKPFEITRYTTLDGKSKVPSQLKACELFKQLHKDLDYIIVDLEGDVVKDTETLQEIFDDWKATLNSPIDGVVYCDETWSYPLYREEAKGVKYGKYAMKPSDTFVSKLENVEYSIAKDGKLTPVVCFKTINYCGKTCNRARSCITNIDNFIREKGLGIGSTIDITFQKGITPDMTGVEANTSDEVLTLPKICPVCKGILILKRTKTITTLTCTNANCRGILTKKLNHFCTNLKIKGYGDKSINKLLLAHDLEEAMKLMCPLKETLLNADISDLLIALDLYSKTTLKKNAIAFNIKDRLVRDELQTVRDVILKDIDSPIVNVVKRNLM